MHWKKAKRLLWIRGLPRHLLDSSETLVIRLDFDECPKAHKGTLETDTLLLDSYGRLPENQRQFYLDARVVLTASPTASISNRAIIDAARKAGLPLISGPMLGDVSATDITVWFRPVVAETVTARVTNKSGTDKKTFTSLTKKTTARRPGYGCSSSLSPSLRDRDCPSLKDPCTVVC